MTAFLGEGEGGSAPLARLFRLRLRFAWASPPYAAPPSRVYFGSAFASRGLRLHTPRPPLGSTTHGFV